MTPQFGASLTDDTRVITYDHNVYNTGHWLCPKVIQLACKVWQNTNTLAYLSISDAEVDQTKLECFVWTLAVYS